MSAIRFENVNLVLTAGLPSQLPGILRQSFPQVALCGRSNVGKSSLINRLVGRKNYARVSSSPGKTITVNAYDVDAKLYLVDLPGYGYAKRSFDKRDSWKDLIDRYFATDADRLYFQLIDLKVGITPDDERMLSYLKDLNLPFAVIATKADKVNATTRKANLEALQTNRAIPEDCAVLPFSALTGDGTEEIREIIREFYVAARQ